MLMFKFFVFRTNLTQTQHKISLANGNVQSSFPVLRKGGWVRNINELVKTHR